MKNYTVRIDFSEKNGRHAISETWLCRGDTALRKRLIDALDIPKDGPASPAKPDFAAVERAVGAGRFAKREFARQKRGYAAYGKIMWEIGAKCRFVAVPVDANTCVTVAAN